MSTEANPTTRDFTVAVFVVHDNRVLLHPHRKLNLWLPPGGHIEPNELPDQAAIREVMEEAGIGIRLLQDGDPPIDRPGQPRQLTRPIGIQLESITPGHEHIDLIYFAIPVESGPELEGTDGMTWLSLDDIRTRTDITEEILDWSTRAIEFVATHP
jgi:8-oxo-dGTP pyrophosphatase MutT (NUDIX family)